MEMGDAAAVIEAEAAFREGLNALRRCVDLLRGPGITASGEAMATEIAVSRAIQGLETAGFLRPLPPARVVFSGTVGWEGDDE